MTIVEMQSAQWEDLNIINNLQESLRIFQENTNAQMQEVQDRMNERQQLITAEQSKSQPSKKK